mmetsp:Transcript_15595/g.24198  ORF Transcript_15595/g.24198 Transcript_15595/m.24198 type:complete len:297 (+) Transcript_15595:64-954(+)
MSNPDYTITGVAFSNETILILCSFGFATLGIVLFLILRNQPQHHNDEDENTDRDNYGDVLGQADVATLNRAQRRARAKYKMKQARRDMAPAVAARGGEGDDNIINMPAEERVPEDVVVNNDFAGIVDRKERQRIAKQMERNERKIYSMEAQKWRDRNQASSKKKKKKLTSEVDNVVSESNFSVEDVFPKRLDKHDPSSDYLFWESIVRGIQDKNFSTDELISQCETAQSKTMTIREFVKRVENSGGSVSVIDLADKFEISVPDAMTEIARWNDLYNIRGMVDSCGNFVILPSIATQ